MHWIGEFPYCVSFPLAWALYSFLCFISVILHVKCSVSQKSWWGFAPALFPDLTSHDFYFWGYVKRSEPVIYTVRIHNIQNLKQRIREAAAAVSITVDVLGRVWQEIEFRSDVCRAPFEPTYNFNKHAGKKLFELFNLIHV
jgi:hypothetical protein